jgi:hypothetical protein
VLLTGAACSKGENSTGDDTTREISEEELSRMVLQLTSFGPEYSGFTADAENGVDNIDKSSEDDFDPAGERADLETFGFATGYQSYYTGQGVPPGGAFGVGSEAVLFQTAEGAKGYFDDSDQELAEQTGKTSGTVTILEVSPFDIDTGADQDSGARGTARYAQEDGSSTDVWIVVAQYRRGRLLGFVGMYAIAPGDTEKQRLEGKVEALARQMNQQMALVLAGGQATGAPAAAGQ